MSASRFARFGYKSASEQLARNPVVIDGGKPIYGVLNAVNLARQDKDTGYTPETTFAAVFDAVEFAKAYPSDARQYLGKKARTLGKDFRVVTIDSGQTFVKVMLETIQKG